MSRGALGTRREHRGVVRALLLVMLVGCNPFAVPEHPAVIPKLSEVPEDKRDEVLDSSFQRPGPENRPKTAKGRRQETLAAFAAAVIGDMLSKDENVTLGLEWIDVTPQKKPKTDKPEQPDQQQGDKKQDDAAKPRVTTQPSDLVPWVRLK